MYPEKEDVYTKGMEGGGGSYRSKTGAFCKEGDAWWGEGVLEYALAAKNLGRSTLLADW